MDRAPPPRTNQPHKPIDNPEVQEFLRAVGTYRETFPTAVSIWGPVCAKATRIDAMMEEHWATWWEVPDDLEGDLGEKSRPWTGFKTVAPNANQRHHNQHTTNTPQSTNHKHTQGQRTPRGGGGRLARHATRLRWEVLGQFIVKVTGALCGEAAAPGGVRGFPEAPCAEPSDQNREHAHHNFEVAHHNHEHGCGWLIVAAAMWQLAECIAYVVLRCKPSRF
jgi:hypothetical protein